MTILLMFQKAGPDLKGPLTLFARRQEGLLCYEEPHDIRSKINSRPKTNPVKQLLGGFGIAITRREKAASELEYGLRLVRSVGWPNRVSEWACHTRGGQSPERRTKSPSRRQERGKRFRVGLSTGQGPIIFLKPCKVLRLAIFLAPLIQFECCRKQKN